jgi:hypothetical protein
MNYWWINMGGSPGRRRNGKTLWQHAFELMRSGGFIWIHGKWSGGIPINGSTERVRAGDKIFVYQVGDLTDLAQAVTDAKRIVMPEAIMSFDTDPRPWPGYRFEARFSQLAVPRPTPELSEIARHGLAACGILNENTWKAKGGPNGKIRCIPPELAERLLVELA